MNARRNSARRNRVVASGFLLVLLTELIAIVVARRWALPVAGVAVAVLAYELRGQFAGAKPEPAPIAPPNEALESLQRWRSQTETLVGWADAGRGEWDRHLRPKLAREFLLTTRQKEASGDGGRHLTDTGRMVFGDDLWPWVDPQNAQFHRRDEPGPGRAALDEILRRLEQA